MSELQTIKREFKVASNFLVAVGDQKRQAIIIALLNDKVCDGLRVTELTKATNLSRPAVSHHLKILKQANIVNFKSVGTKNYYFLAPNTKEIDKLQKLLNNVTGIMKRKLKK